MKLGKKLIATPAEKAMLLEKGEMFTLGNGDTLYYDCDITSCFRVSPHDAPTPNIGEPIVAVWQMDWYHEIKTFTINGFEMPDHRVTSSHTDECHVVNLMNPYLPHVVCKGDASIEYALQYGVAHTISLAAIKHGLALLNIDPDTPPPVPVLPPMDNSGGKLTRDAALKYVAINWGVWPKMFNNTSHVAPNGWFFVVRNNEGVMLRHYGEYYTNITQVDWLDACSHKNKD